MNKAEIERVVQLSRVAQGKPTKRPAKEILTAEKAVAGKTALNPVYTGTGGKMTAPEA